MPGEEAEISDHQNSAAEEQSKCSDHKHGTRSSQNSYNSTSTYVYSHESYDTFQQKVLALAHSFSDVKEAALERLRGGSYNRVVVVKIQTKQGRKLDGILRIPRFPIGVDPGDPGIDHTIIDQAAVLQFLARQHVSAPKLYAFDATVSNPIDQPYTYLEYSASTCLEKLYNTMSHREQLSIVDAVVDFLFRLERIKLSKAGILHAAKASNAPLKASYIDGQMEHAVVAEVRNFNIGVGSFGIPHERDSKSSYDLLRQHLRGWARIQDDDRYEDAEFHLWAALSSILEEMNGLGFLDPPYGGSNEECVLFHWDFEARNIMVRPKRNSDSTGPHGDGDLEWEIDMVIDWDDVQSVPPVLARKPPVWLWDDMDNEKHDSIPDRFDYDVDLLNPSRYDAASARLSEDKQKIRDHFEKTYVSKMMGVYPLYNHDIYMDEAYGRGRWLRRLARFAIHGVSDNEDFYRLDKLKEDWLAYKVEHVDISK